jgi:hypothetical protein
MTKDTLNRKKLTWPQRSYLTIFYGCFSYCHLQRKFSYCLATVSPHATWYTLSPKFETSHQNISGQLFILRDFCNAAATKFFLVVFLMA